MTAKESLQMVIQVIEIHSVKRAKLLAALLIDLLNSKACRDFLEEKIKSSPSVQSILKQLDSLSHKVPEKQKAVSTKLTQLNDDLLNKTLFESLQCMKEIVAILADDSWMDEEVEEIRRLLSENDAFDVSALAQLALTPTSACFILEEGGSILEDTKLSDREKISKIWSNIVDKDADSENKPIADAAERNRNKSIFKGQKSALEDFEDGLKRMKTGVDEFIDSIHKNIQGLNVKLTTAQGSSVNNILAPIAKGAGWLGSLFVTKCQCPVLEWDRAELKPNMSCCLYGAHVKGENWSGIANVQTVHAYWMPFAESDKIVSSYLFGNINDNQFHDILTGWGINIDRGINESINFTFIAWISCAKTITDTIGTPIQTCDQCKYLPKCSQRRLELKGDLDENITNLENLLTQGHSSLFQCLQLMREIVDKVVRMDREIKELRQREIKEVRTAANLDTFSARVEVVEGSALRFQNRKGGKWFENTENFLFDYIRGKKTDPELSSFICREELEADLGSIREALVEWIKNTQTRVDRWRIPVDQWEISKALPLLNKDGLMKEFERAWAFVKALFLDNKTEIELHSDFLRTAVEAACAGSDGIAPVISYGRLSDGERRLKLKFMVAGNANVREIKDFVTNVARVFDADVSGGNRQDGNAIEFSVNFREDQENNVRVFMRQVVTKMAELAELHVRFVMLGNYDITSGARLTNPAFNRTYGNGLSAPGFMPTGDFGFLDYSGDKYFCPKGWRRISINVASSAAEFDRKYGGWHVAYHGTKHELSATILTSGFIPSSGAYSDGKNVVYFSPSIVYASRPCYSEVYPVPDSSGRTKYVQMILQVRINPTRIWKKVGGTLPGAYPPDHRSYKADRDGTPADPNFPENRNLEWLVQPAAGKSGLDMFSDAFVVYGIMIRDSYTDPTTHPENAWWAKLNDRI